ncbi:thioredoxin family protein [Brevibacillus sp. FSL K6-0770]|uniref:thioredoxin family protein n=1 Tax=unclassified Brevibacillus TaxID=2684853 RepID=UPI0024745981|nr:thioredoxin family protein [Brevibacillus sp. 1238]MDH6351018.1 thioredoxin-like negative regulator of GroEL [Brevibacillus sp. 1238]
MKRVRHGWWWSVLGGAILLGALIGWASGFGTKEAKIIYVFSNSCGYCTTFTPTFEKVAKDYPQEWVARLDIQRDRELDEAMRLGAQATPTVFIVDGERVIDKLEGDVPEALLRSFLQRNLERDLSING